MGPKDKLKYLVWVPWFAALLYFLLANASVLVVEPFFQIEGGISVSAPAFYVVYYGVIVLILALCLALGRRAMCHYICWMAPFMILGRKLGQRLGLLQMHLYVDEGACIACGRCTKACPMGIDVLAGFQKGKMEHAECNFCGECVSVCPNRVLRRGFGR